MLPVENKIGTETYLLSFPRQSKIRRMVKSHYVEKSFKCEVFDSIRKIVMFFMNESHLQLCILQLILNSSPNLTMAITNQ